MPRAIVEEGTLHRGEADEIIVNLTRSTESCMKVRLDPSHTADADGGRQVGIHRRLPVLRAHAAAVRNIRVKALGLGMNPGIGASCGGYAQGLPQNIGRRCLDGVLHRAPAGLALPPPVGCAVVGAGEEESAAHAR